MLFSVPAEDYKINNVFADVINFTTACRSEQNASTSIKTAGSSGANPFVAYLQELHHYGALAWRR